LTVLTPVRQHNNGKGNGALLPHPKPSTPNTAGAWGLAGTQGLPGHPLGPHSFPASHSRQPHLGFMLHGMVCQLSQQRPAVYDAHVQFPSGQVKATVWGATAWFSVQTHVFLAAPHPPRDGGKSHLQRSFLLRTGSPIFWDGSPTFRGWRFQLRVPEAQLLTQDPLGRLASFSRASRPVASGCNPPTPPLKPTRGTSPSPASQRGLEAPSSQPQSTDAQW
jgi:hypothetical protein